MLTMNICLLLILLCLPLLGRQLMHFGGTGNAVDEVINLTHAGERNILVVVAICSKTKPQVGLRVYVIVYNGDGIGAIADIIMNLSRLQNTCSGSMLLSLFKNVTCFLLFNH